MEVWQALVLGIVQGLTEFLPISSSGHLVIIQQLFGLQASGEELLGFDLALHFGTLLSVVAVFYKDIGDMIAGCFRVVTRRGVKNDAGAHLAWLVIVGTIPAVVIALAFADFFRSLFDSAFTAGLMLLVTGAILFVTRFVKRSDRSQKDLRAHDAILVGCAQALAILPGISRSGTTISAGLFRNWDRKLAARFSFLLAVPAILGGIVFELENLSQWSVTALGPLIIGVVAAAISGYIAIHWLLRVVQRGNLSHFAYYCWAVGLAAVLWFS